MHSPTHTHTYTHDAVSPQAQTLHSSYALDGTISEEAFVQIILKSGAFALGKTVNVVVRGCVCRGECCFSMSACG